MEYSLYPLNDYFEISPFNGAIHLKKVLDYETQLKKFNFTIQVKNLSIKIFYSTFRLLMAHMLL